MLKRLQTHIVAPSTIVDVGANIGQFTIAATKTYPNARVYSFEPLDDCYASLSRAVRELPNVEIRNVALGESPQQLILNRNTYPHSSSFLELGELHKQAFPRALVDTSISVPVSTLNDEFRSREIAAPAILKIDVQGYELPVLRGADEILHQFEWIIVEMSLQPLYENEPLFGEVIQFATENGYQLVQIVGYLVDPNTGAFLQMDGLFRRNAV